MRFGYTIIYVENVKSTIDFYQRAFSLPLLFIHESEHYAELDTGNTKLAFASNQMAEMNGLNIHPNTKNNLSAGIEIAFITDNVAAAFRQACKAGAKSIKAPEQKPWGQLVAHVLDCNGVIVELCSPIG